MRTVKIDRQKWLRGQQNSFLWQEKLNAGCCLGHACKQISRISEAKLDLMQAPDEIFKKESFLTVIDNSSDFPCINNDFASDAMIINDNTEIDDDYRENQLIRLFKKNGIKLIFYGQGNPNESI